MENIEKKDVNVLQLFLAGLKRNFRPAIILQISALLIVLAYYFVPQWASLLNQLGDLKDQYGLLFSAISTVIFGGLVAYIIMIITGQIEKKHLLSHLLFYIFFWTWKGMEVDLFYQFQGWVFGTEPSFQVVAVKVIVDQLIYGPLWAVPTMTIFYLWKDSGFSIKNMKKALHEVPLLRRLLTVLVSNLIVWVPSVSIIYSLPGNLQLPLFNIVLCFWALILQFVAKGKSK